MLRSEVAYLLGSREKLVEELRAQSQSSRARDGLECGVPALGGDAVPLAERQVRRQLREGRVAVDRRVLLVQALRSDDSYLILIKHNCVRFPCHPSQLGHLPIFWSFTVISISTAN